MDVNQSNELCVCSIENPVASDQVFQAVGDALQKFPFSYQGARLLSGQEEGAFGWVTVNYLDDRLKQVCMQMFSHKSMQVCPLLCASVSVHRLQCIFCLGCRAWKPQAPLTLAEPRLR